MLPVSTIVTSRWRASAKARLVSLPFVTTTGWIVQPRVIRKRRDRKPSKVVGGG
jgi:hypothetical protein